MEQIQPLAYELFSVIRSVGRNGGWWFLAGWLIVGCIWCICMIVFGRGRGIRHS